MRRSGLSHFAKRVVDAAFVKFVAAGAVNEGLAERLVGPFHAARQDVDATGQHDDVSVCCGWFEGANSLCRSE